MMEIGKAERLEYPVEFQEYLRQIFGVNHFDGPMFRIIWGQTETMDIATLHGYELKLVGHNQPCWIIQMWRPPEIYGTPEIYYALTADPDTGLAMLGEYPQFGRYETITPLMSKHFNSQTMQLEIETLPLDWEIIDKAIPVLLNAQELTYWERKAAAEAAEAYENAQQVSKIADRLYDELPSFYGPVSLSGQANRTALIDRKMAEVERTWRTLRVDKNRQKPKRGFFTEGTN